MFFFAIIEYEEAKVGKIFNKNQRIRNETQLLETKLSGVLTKVLHLPDTILLNIQNIEKY